MIKIAELVKEIITGDDIAREALKLGFLNHSAYALRIKPQLESRLYKHVSKGAIVVALSRIKQVIEDAPDYRPTVVIEHISIQSSLAELSYEKTRETVKKATTLPIQSEKGSFFTLTQGLGEITIICHQNLVQQVEKHMSKQYRKGYYQHLAAVTVKLNESEYIEVPNVIFSLVSMLAVRRLNLIEIVSTYTELSFIVREKNLQETVNALSPFLRK